MQGGGIETEDQHQMNHQANPRNKRIVMFMHAARETIKQGQINQQIQGVTQSRHIVIENKYLT